MASACVNNVGMLPENFLDHPPLYPPYNWFCPNTAAPSENSEIDKSPSDFEFRLENPASKMLPADMLFSGGKLVPLHKMPLCPPQLKAETAESHDLPSFSPKAPRCSTRWKELLGLKKALSAKPPNQNARSNLYASVAENAKSLKHFLYRNTKSSSSDASLSIPLLRDSDSESLSISSRLSLSSSSSGEDFPRLSFDSEKPNPVQSRPRLKFRKVKTSSLEGNGALRTADSPRLNASGKVIFQGLERSSSSPSSFSGRQRSRPNGMERSYSANVRVTPVLNVPVCSLRGAAISVSVFGIGQFFSTQKKEKKCFNSGSNGVRNGV